MSLFRLELQCLCTVCRLSAGREEPLDVSVAIFGGDRYRVCCCCGHAVSERRGANRHYRKRWDAWDRRVRDEQKEPTP